MPECVFAERRLNSTSRSIEPSRSSASKPSNGSGGAPARLPAPRAPAARTATAIARLGERVGDRQVGDRGGEQHRAVGLLRPEEAEDVAASPSRREVARRAARARSLRAPVELADVRARPRPPTKIRPGREVVGAEVDERADRPLLAHGRGDQRLVDAVLQRDDEAVGREPRRDRVPAPSRCAGT